MQQTFNQSLVFLRVEKAIEILALLVYGTVDYTSEVIPAYVGLLGNIYKIWASDQKKGLDFLKKVMIFELKIFGRLSPGKNHLIFGNIDNF